MTIDPRLGNSLGTPQGVAGRVVSVERRLRTLESVRTFIGAQSVQGSHIAAGAITAASIQAGSIEAIHIAANAVTAGAIAADAIQTHHLSAEAVTADKIEAASITGSHIAAGTITGTNITAGTITGSLLASETITGDRLVSGTITADKLSVSDLSAVSANLGNITAGTITGATFRTSASNPRVVLDATGLSAVDAAGTTTVKIDAATGKVITLAGIGGANLLRNAGAEDITGSTTYGSVLPGWTVLQTAQMELRRTTSTVRSGASAIQYRRKAGTGTGALYAVLPVADRVPVKPGDSIAGSAYIRAISTNANFNVALRFFDAGGVQVGASLVGTSVTTSSSAWSRVVAENVTVPSGAVTVDIGVGTLSAPELAEFVVDDIQVEVGGLVTAYAPKPDEVLPQTISGGGGAGQITPGTIVGTDIVADSITATEIAASTITSVEIAAATITGGDIAAGTITGANIAAGTITADRLSVATLSAITADMGTITAGTITGATFRTSASNPKVQMDSTGLYKTDSSGNKVVNLGPTGGLDLLAGTTDTPPNERRLRWMRESDGLLVGDIASYRALTNVALGMHVRDPSNTTKFANMDMTVGSATTLVTAEAGFGGVSSSAIVLRNDGVSSFIKKAGALGNIRVHGPFAFGASGIKAPGDRWSHVITHNIGSTSFVAVGYVHGHSSNVPDAVNWGIMHWSATQCEVILQNVSGVFTNIDGWTGFLIQFA